MEKIKGALFHLGVKWEARSRARTTMWFDESLWNDMFDEAVKAGLNTVFVDIHEALRYSTHPELAVEDAWTKQRMRREIARFKDAGILLTPKLNFSATHDWWLGEYAKIRSTKEYYRVCRELIEEMCHLFPDAKYFNIGMDEEDYTHQAGRQHVNFRRGKAYFDDMQFLCDCVRDGGKTPIVWYSALIKQYEDFKKYIEPEDIILGISHYHGVKPEHWIRTDSREDYYNYYYVKGPYVGQNMEILERDDPFYIRFYTMAKQTALDGYDTLLNCSNYYRHPHNASDLVEYAMTEWPKERLRGVMTSMWFPTIEQYREPCIDGIRLLGEAIKKHHFE